MSTLQSSRVKRQKYMYAGVLTLSAVLFPAGNAAAQFQSMMIPPGTYRFAGPGTLPAFCLNRNLPAPLPTHVFNYVSPSMTFQKFDQNGKSLGDPIPAEIARRQGDVRFHGAESGYSQVIPEFPKLSPGESAVIHVGKGPGVLAPDGKKGEDAASSLTKNADSLQNLESFAKSLEEGFGSNSGVARYFHESRQNAIWNPLTSDEAIKHFKKGFSSLDAKDALAFLTTLHGKELTPNQIKAAKELFHSGIDPEDLAYPDGFLAELSKYTSARNDLIDVFGDGHLFVRAFEKRTAGQVAGGLVEDAVNVAGQALIPERLREHPELTWELVALTRGVRLTDGQIKVLNDLFHLDLSASIHKLDHNLLLSESDHGTVQLATTRGIETISLVDLTPSKIKTMVGDSGRVVANGPISPATAEALNKAGVLLVRDFGDFLDAPLAPEVKSTQFIMVGSESESENKFIFEDQAPGSLRKAVKKLPEVQGRLAPTALDLEIELARAVNAGDRPVVFFHNSEQGIRFADETSMSLKDFSVRFGIYQPLCISCETYKDGRLLFRTTDSLPVNDVLNAYGEANATLAKGPMRTDDFLDLFAKRYSGIQGRRTKLFLVKGSASVGITILTGIVAGIVIKKLNDDDKDKDKNKDKKPSDGQKPDAEGKSPEEKIRNPD
jgi:hypothetical protein